MYNDAIIQQTFVVEFVVQNQQCPDCEKSYTENVGTYYILLLYALYLLSGKIII